MVETRTRDIGPTDHESDVLPSKPPTTPHEETLGLSPVPYLYFLPLFGIQAVSKSIFFTGLGTLEPLYQILRQFQWGKPLSFSAKVAPE